MAICRRIGTVAFVWGAIASVVIVTGADGAAARSNGGKGTAPAALVASGKAFANCPSGYFCDYIYDNGYGLCFKVNPFRGYPSDNWSRYGCRNVDGAIWNNTPFTYRVFFSPNHGDPHACIPPWRKVRDLFNYDFNSGSGPHNLVIGNDIASFTFSLSSCTNTPL